MHTCLCQMFDEEEDVLMDIQTASDTTLNSMDIQTLHKVEDTDDCTTQTSLCLALRENVRVQYTNEYDEVSDVAREQDDHYYDVHLHSNNTTKADDPNAPLLSTNVCVRSVRWQPMQNEVGICFLLGGYDPMHHGSESCVVRIERRWGPLPPPPPFRALQLGKCSRANQKKTPELAVVVNATHRSYSFYDVQRYIEMLRITLNNVRTGVAAYTPINELFVNTAFESLVLTHTPPSHSSSSNTHGTPTTTTTTTMMMSRAEINAHADEIWRETVAMLQSISRSAIACSLAHIRAESHRVGTEPNERDLTWPKFHK